MNDEAANLRLLLADVIDGLAANERRLSGLSVSVMAMRLALRDVSPEKFEAAYARHFAELERQGHNRSSLENVDFLIALAQKLRGQS